jgi:hypothetical protein
MIRCFVWMIWIIQIVCGVTNETTAETMNERRKATTNETKMSRTIYDFRTNLTSLPHEPPTTQMLIIIFTSVGVMIVCSVISCYCCMPRKEGKIIPNTTLSSRLV